DFALPQARLLAWARRGAAECEARGLWGGARRHLGALLEGSSDPALFARRGKALAQLRRYDDALADLGKAIAAVGGRPDWYAARGEAGIGLGRWDQAAEDLARATKLDERRGEAWRLLGRVEAERGRWKQAADALAKAIRFGAAGPGASSEHALALL